MTTNIMFLRDMKTMTKRDMNMKQGLAKAMLLTLLFLVGGMVNGVWAYNYTYNVIDANGAIVATATTSSSTLELPAAIKAVSCRVRFYCSGNETTDRTDAQNMNLTSEITSLPENDATIYVGYRYSMRIFPNADSGLYGYIVQDNGGGNDVSNGLGYDSSTSSFVLMSIGNSTDNDNYRWQFGGNPYKATLKWKGDTDKYLHYNGSNFELSSTPSYFMIIYNTHDSSKYAFRLNDEVNTTVNYLDRDGNKNPKIYKGTYGSTFGLHKGQSYEPWYDVYDSYGNFVVNRHNNGGWTQNSYTTTLTESNMSNPLGNEQSRWVKDLKVYATNPGQDPNAVVLERTPHTPDRIEYMQFSPRLKDDNVPGILQALGSEDVLDLTGQTKYQIRINGTNYIYAKNETTAGYTSNELELRGDAYLWRLKGGDPYHIILENAGNGKVLTYSLEPSYSTIEKSNNTIARSTSSTGSNVLTLSALGEAPHTYQCFGLMTKVLYRSTGAYTFDYLIAQGYSNNWPAIQTYNNQVILKTDYAPWGSDSSVKVEFIPYVNRADVQYVVIDNEGNEAVEYTASSETLQMPASIKSPLATDYRFYNTKAKAVSDLPADRITDIDDAEDLGGDEKRVYVRYTLDPAQTLLGTNSYMQMTFVAQSSRILGIANSNGTGSDRQVYGSDADYWKYYQDSWLWRIDGTDPYNFTIRNFSDESYICKTSNTSGQPVTTTTTAADGAHFIMLYNDYSNETGMSLLLRPNTSEDNYMLMEGNGAPPVFTDRSAADLAALLVTARESNYYNVNFSGVTYIVVSHDGSIATMSTTSDAAGATPSLPAIINSPLATNFRYYSSLTDARNDDGTAAYVAAHAITSLPSEHCSVFVRYDNNLASTDFDLSGDLSHHIIHYNTGKYAVVPASASNGNILQDKTEEQAKADIYCSWSIFGNDPYNVKIYSVAEPTRNLRIEDPAKNNNRNIAICGTPESTFYSADNYCPLDRFIILGGGYTGTYYLMEATNRRTNTRYYARNNSAEIKFEPKDYYVDYSKDWFKNERSFRFVSPFKRDVTFHIIDRNGREAISATREWHTDKALPTVAVAGGAIPTEIYSPYLEGETLTWYGGYDAEAKSVTGDPITRMDNSASDVYVTYTNDHLSEKPLHFGGARGFEMKVNGHYVYDNSGTLQSTDSETDKDEKEHLWNTIGNDPYAVQVRNVGTPTLFFNWSISPTQSLTLGSGSGDNTYFIAMKRTDDTENMVTELMAATGANLSSSDYYSIGRLAEGEPTMLRSDSYPHDHAAIQIILTPAHFDVTYRVIDKQNKIVLEVPATEIDLGLPDAWKSPLVSDDGYHYWIKDRFNISGDIYELKSGLTNANEVVGISESTDGYIYVTYDVITDESDPNYIDLNSTVDYTERVSRSATDNTQVRNAGKFGAMYMLQFTSSDAYKLENGDYEDEATTASGTTVYPYTNGDGPIYVYTDAKWESQKNGGASTRTRWPWYLLSPNNDPYHVMVTSWQNSHANNGTNYYSFLRTFYNETLGSVVTNNVTDDPRTLDDDDNQILPTEYMLLNGNGTTGKYMLKTTKEINGTHEPVTSFEQYWRNNPTVHRTLGLSEGSGPITDTQKQTLRNDHGWHNYDYYANAAAWTGGTGSSNKSYAKEEHWFMTVKVGDGSFNIVPSEIDAVLVLLDNHGWEIMRQNIAKHSETTKYAATQESLRKYDSPMVSQYKFYGYRNVTHKVPGYHKYVVAETDRVNPSETYTSLADYPEKYSGGALYDLYVTYDVKAQYAEAYTGAATSSQTVVNYPFIIRQDGKLAKTTDGTTLSTVEASTTGIDAGTTEGLDDQDLYWNLKPNFNIDREMGYLYDVKDADNNVIDEATTNVNYHTNGQSGFDPYNIQIVNKKHGGYFTTNANGASMVNHRYLEGTYPTTNGTLSLVSEPSAQFNPTITDYDSKELHITNATFMAVQDANGNMRLMPRFDHSRVITDFATVEPQHAGRPEDDKVDGQSTILLRPTIYTYIIVDNSGREALRYTGLSSGAPSTPSQYKSPLATSFKYYKTLVDNGSDYNLSTLGDEIAGSFADAGMSTGGTVYVRYDYNRDSDTQGLLQGMWLTMQLNSSDRQYNSGNVTTGTVDATQSAWQWRLLQKAADEPDPYSVSLYSATNTDASISINSQNRFAILRFNNEDNAYALVVAGTKSTDTYTFVNGSAANATTAVEAAAFKNSGTIVDANKVQFTTNVNPTTITYRLVTNLKHIALTGDASATTDYVPSMPQWMRSPLMKNEEDTYQYYAGATASGTEYTVNNPTKTLRNLDIEDGKSVVYVRYDYETSKQAAAYNSGDTKAVLNLDGSVPYRFALNTYQAVKVKDDNMVDVQNTGKLLLMHDARSLWYFTGNDPYEFKISNYYDESKFISAQDVAEGYDDGVRQPVKMLADVNETYKFNTFMMLKAPGENNSSPEKALTCYVSGSQRIFLIELTNYLRVYKHDKDYSECYKDGDKIWPGNNIEQKHFRFVPAMAYHVITNSGQEAIVAASDFTGFETVTIPNAIHSPLLNKSDFRYYTRINTDDSGTISVDPDSEIADNTAIYDHVANGEGDIYIRYTYDRDDSPRQFLDGYDKTTTHGLDLSGSTWYTMVECGSLSSNKPVYNHIIWAYTDTSIRYNKEFNTDPSKLMTKDEWKLSDKRLLWCLEGNDPYAIRIRNAHKGKSIYATGKNSNDNVYFIQEGNETGEEYTTFMYLTFASEGEKNVAKEDMGATFVPTGHWNDDRCFNTQSGDMLKMFKWGDNTLVSRLGADNFNNNGNSYNCWISFYKAPAGRKYHYHAYNQTKGEWTWDAVLEHDFLTPLVLEDNIARLYAKYEANTMGTTLAVTGSNDFQTRTALEAADNAQFYSNEGMTERVYDTNSNTYDVYPEIDEDECCDIYFKYQVDNEATVNLAGKGLKLGQLTSTEDNIKADIELHQANNGLSERDNQIKANWFFMVLDTDEDITATGSGSDREFVGKQMFLRREDDGSVDWMNNAYTLHKLSEDNYNGWSYNRLAEWYKTGDHGPFREGRWLWSFVGDDPYNMRIVNFESVLGVTDRRPNAYNLEGAEHCYVNYKESTSTDDKGVETTVYTVNTPTEEPSSNYLWGLASGYNGESTFSLVATPSVPDVSGIKQAQQVLYWEMGDNVTLQPRSDDRQNAIQLLPYQPVIYEDVMAVVRNDDNHGYDKLPTDHINYNKNRQSEDLSIYIDKSSDDPLDYHIDERQHSPNGITTLYAAKEDRRYAEGDLIRVDNWEDEARSIPTDLPLELRRKFCTYQIYNDQFVHQDDITITHLDRTNPNWPQKVFIGYDVTTDMLLKSAPTKSEVETMTANNDHVYFMDFKTGYHAYYDPTATTQSLFSNKVSSERRSWTLSDNDVTDANAESGFGTATYNGQSYPYNYTHFATNTNRMVSTPERLKWYFVGDPYGVQVYNVAGFWGNDGNGNEVAANLCRFDPMQSTYQFVVDRVHLRIPHKTFIDRRTKLYLYDADGEKVSDGKGGYKTVDNANEGHPFFDDFLWEMVPSTQGDDYFALRYKNDHLEMGYEDIYYYLGDSNPNMTRQYTAGQEQNYKINLCYDYDNDKIDNGDYEGYHKNNNQVTAIKLIQPAKVYVTANRLADDTGRAAQENVVVEELSEYYGLGETLEDVPRHLQRKYVDYSNLQNSKTGATTNELTKANATTIGSCSTHDSNVYRTGADINPKFYFKVSYTVNDKIANTDDSGYSHVFSINESDPQWIDVELRNNNWLYFDKNNGGTSTVLSNFGASDKTSGYSSGDNTGLKGLHWALVGDPYNFYLINRRKKDDSQTDKYVNTASTTVNESVSTQANHFSTVTSDLYIVTTSASQDVQYDYAKLGSNTTDEANTSFAQWSLVYTKWGSADDFFIRTYGNREGVYERLIVKTITSEGSSFATIPFSLETEPTAIQKAKLGTAVVKDKDAADNDCFDGNVYVLPKGETDKSKAKAYKLNAELKYGDAIDNMPLTLKRYGCTYECYAGSVAPANKIMTFEEDNSALHSGTGYPDIYYVYEVTAEAQSFFTTLDEAKQDAYIWTNANFSWEQYYEGTNVRVEDYYEKFDHYVYNSSGHIIDEVWVKVDTVYYTSGKIYSEAYGWANSHDDNTRAFADKRTQDETDAQKWAFVGDPYDFQMKNYAQYLVNGESALGTNGARTENTQVYASNIGSEQSHWALMQGDEQKRHYKVTDVGKTIGGHTVTAEDVGKEYTVKDDDGNIVYNYYLALIDENGNILRYVTFDRIIGTGKDAKDNPASEQYFYLKGSVGLNGDPESDPTGNLYDATGVRPFNFAALIRYASLVTYHLVIAHQHSLDYEDKNLPLTAGGHDIISEEQKENIENTVKQHLVEYLTYKSPAYLNDAKDDVKDGKENEVTEMLRKDGTLRDFVSYPVEDYSVTSVGVGNRITVPWYMKRQFCTYKTYLKDIKFSRTSNRPMLDEYGNQMQASDGTALYEVDWISVTADDLTDKEKEKYEEVGTYLNTYRNKEINTIDPLMHNHRVEVDVVYEVNPSQFRFADQGRNTTAWYSMMTTNPDDGLMNFSYHDDVGARKDRQHHYTNNYLWAPQGDPYGFVLRSRYATINGTGWDDVVVTTNESLPKKLDDLSGLTNGDTKGRATYTTKLQADKRGRFVDERIVHFLKDHWREDGTQVVNDAAANAIYEMFVGKDDYTFLMHPTSSYIDISGDRFSSYYMKHNTTTHKAELVYTDEASKLRNDDNDANWRLFTTPEQLLPYFDRAGYVGGLEPTVANHYQNLSLRNRLTEYKAQDYVNNPTVIDFQTIDEARKVVYAGKFWRVDETGAKIDSEPWSYLDARPNGTNSGDNRGRLRFESDNLINLGRGYYRIIAFSGDALDDDGKDMSKTEIQGIIGPRYISGYRFDSEKVDNPSHADDGGRWLHFLETDAAHSTIHDYATLKSKITSVDDALHNSSNRDIFDHKAMRGSIEILPAEYDLSSIFYFDPVANDRFDRFTISTQGLQLRARAGETQAVAGTIDSECGHTMLEPENNTLKTNYSNKFRLADIGGTAVTLRTLKEDTGDWDQLMETNIQTNYVCIDRNHRYRITCHNDNEMMEIGDHYDNLGLDAIQDTKWLLQPVGVKKEWPYNELPLRIEVHEGGVKDQTLSEPDLSADANKDKNYYGTFYAPFDIRLNRTTDVAFTLTSTPKDDSMRMSSVSQINNMGNPQFVPANWPVVIRTDNPGKDVLKQEDGTTYRTVNYVEAYLPNLVPTVIPNNINTNLKGEYLEQTLADATLNAHPDTGDKRVMVFGLPFAAPHTAHTADTKERVGWYTNENWARENDNAYDKALDTDATDEQRDNRYVYHNKVYYVYDGASPSRQFYRVYFDDEDYDIHPDDPFFDEVTDDVPWPCDVYDMTGRKVATNETPATLRSHHPELPKGIYIFGGLKMIIK